MLGAAALPQQTTMLLLVRFATLARRHPVRMAGAIVGLMIAARLCCLPMLPRPSPLIADEFSHLFLAQTLASGAVANPPHAMWRHFETLFILQSPAYVSVYPPVQGLFLASGFILFHDLWAGVLMAVAGMCIAVIWMLRGWTNPFWALYGGLLTASAFGMLSYWVNSYWGGAGAAIGGALVFGSLPRMLSRRRCTDAVALAVGLLILANSRPYEGFLISLPVAYWLLRRPSGGFTAPTLAHARVLAGVLAGGALLTGWYNWRATGTPFSLPYVPYIRQYATAPAFVWQSPRPVPEYSDRVLHDAHVSFLADYTEYSTLAGAFRRTYKKAARLSSFYLGPFWPLVFLGFPDFARVQRFRVLSVSLAVCVLGILLTVGFQPHYAAPCTSIFILLIIDMFRRIRRQWRRAGLALIIAAPPSWLAAQLLTAAPPPPNSLEHRPAIQAQLAAEPGDHLVLVRYAASHPLGEEWVYNEPAIDRSRVIWARDLGPKLNRELIDYFAGRRVWLLEPDSATPRLTRYQLDLGSETPKR